MTVNNVTDGDVSDWTISFGFGGTGLERVTVNSATHCRIVSFIWGIANDVLRDLYVSVARASLRWGSTLGRWLGEAIENGGSVTYRSAVHARRHVHYNQIGNS